jgi:uncharacterized protein (TIGR03435 family)
MRRVLQAASLAVCLTVVAEAPRGLMLAALAVGVGIARSVYAQQPHASTFDVVSIKRNTSGAAESSLRPDSNGLTGVNVNALRLFRVAYQVPSFQIVAAPGWFETERYDILARAGSTVSVGQLQSMTQALLAERFGVRISRERRPVNGYQLRVDQPANRGLQSSARPCATARLDQPRQTGELPPCFRTAPGEMIARGVTLEMLARELQSRVGQPVVDDTGLTEIYDFELRWAPEDGAQPITDGSAPSLFTAVREQLGLRLVAAKPTVDVYVITAAHRAEEN